MVHSCRIGTAFLCAVFLASTLIGCGGNDGPQLAPAKGTVLMGGKPVPNVGVTFFPSTGGPMATGATNEKGEFVMMTIKPGDGAPVGSHKVTLGRAEESTSESGSPFQIPRRYERGDTSGLTAEVKAGEDNVFEFVIKP